MSKKKKKIRKTIVMYPNHGEVLIKQGEDLHTSLPPSISNRIKTYFGKKFSKKEPEYEILSIKIPSKKEVIFNFLFKYKTIIFVCILIVGSFFIGRYSTTIYNYAYNYMYPPKIDTLSLIEYKTEINDSVEDISKKFNISKYTVESSNYLYNDITFRNHTKLIIPNKNVTLQKTLYKWGFTLEKIAKKYYVPVASLKVFYEKWILDSKTGKKIKKLVRQKDIKPDTILNAGYVAVPQLKEKNFIWPMDMGEVPPYIWSPYGWRRNPFNWRHWEMHLGIDIACNRNSVIATKSGRVIFSGVKSGYGLVIIIQHVNGYQTTYAHLSRVYVRKGAYVYQKQRIALSGNTGRSTGPHLHFEIRKEGKFQNPFHYLKYIEAPPVNEKNEKMNTTYAIYQGK